MEKKVHFNEVKLKFGELLREMVRRMRSRNVQFYGVNWTVLENRSGGGGEVDK